MQKRVLAAIGALLITASIAQLAAADDRHARRVKHVAPAGQLRDALGSANWRPAPQSRYQSHTGSSAPAAVEESCDSLACYPD
jgi:hypothetical protein